MSHFEYLESVGQTNIFDFLPIKTDSKRNKSFAESDKVRIRFYADEIEIIQACHPQLMGVGEIVSKKLDFYLVRIGGTELYVDGSKLTLV